MSSLGKKFTEDTDNETDIDIEIEDAFEDEIEDMIRESEDIDIAESENIVIDINDPQGVAINLSESETEEEDPSDGLSENDLIPEIKQQLILLNQETNGLETEIQQLKNVYEELELLKVENDDLKQRLISTEEQHADFVASFKEFMKKRDDALRYLLQEVKTLKTKMNELRASLRSST
jgi:hypothetical protein